MNDSEDINNHDAGQVADNGTPAVRQSQGWIALHRGLLDHPRANDPDWMAVWIYLLLKATHKPRRVNFDGNIIELKPGQLVTGRLAIAKATGVSDAKVYRILEAMKSEHQIEQQAGVKGSVITVSNWGLYQNPEQQSEQRLNSKRTATEQQLNTNNNVNKENNGNNDNKTVGRVAGATPATDEEFLQSLKANPAFDGIDVGREHAKMLLWCQQNRKQPTRKRFVNWLNRVERPMNGTTPAAQANGTTNFYVMKFQLEEIEKEITAIKNRGAEHPHGWRPANDLDRQRLKDLRAKEREISDKIKAM